MSELTQELIQNSLDQDYNKANQVFDTMMGDKMTDLLDQAKIALAGKMFNGEEDDEQLDLDFEQGDDEVSDESSEDQDFEENETDVETEDEFQEEENAE